MKTITCEILKTILWLTFSLFILLVCDDSYTLLQKGLMLIGVLVSRITVKVIDDYQVSLRIQKVLAIQRSTQ